jgi:hypothetical protein
MHRPDFTTLEALPGHPEMRQVDGTWMGREQYETEGWHVVREQTTEEGKPYLYWAATLDGLQRYGRLLAERTDRRRAAYRTRLEEEAEFRAYVDSLEEPE